MRKLVLALGSVSAVVLLALLVHVADEGDRFTSTGSYGQQSGHAHHGHGHHRRGHGYPQRGDGLGDHGHMPRMPDHGKGDGPWAGPGPMPAPMPAPMPGDGGGQRPTYRDVTCHLEDDALVLSYSYGASERVAPFVDARGRGLVVGLEVEGPPPGTIVPSIALLGEARFARFGAPAWIRSPAGKDVPCPQRQP